MHCYLIHRVSRYRSQVPSAAIFYSFDDVEPAENDRLAAERDQIAAERDRLAAQLRALGAEPSP
jgi:hypothetical protein